MATVRVAGVRRGGIRLVAPARGAHLRHRVVRGAGAILPAAGVLRGEARERGHDPVARVGRGTAQLERARLPRRGPGPILRPRGRRAVHPRGTAPARGPARERHHPGGRRLRRAGTGAVLSISRESTAALRELLITHEGFHGVFFALPAFQDACRAAWNALDPDEQAVWLAYLDLKGYNTADPYLVVNEFQSYLFQQERAEVPGLPGRHAGGCARRSPRSPRPCAGSRRAGPTRSSPRSTRSTGRSPRRAVLPAAACWGCAARRREATPRTPHPTRSARRPIPLSELGTPSSGPLL